MNVQATVQLILAPARTVGAGFYRPDSYSRSSARAVGGVGRHQERRAEGNLGSTALRSVKVNRLLQPKRSSMKETNVSETNRLPFEHCLP